MEVNAPNRTYVYLPKSTMTSGFDMFFLDIL